MQRLGRCREKVRYRDAEAVSARAHALAGLDEEAGAEVGGHPAANAEDLATEVEALAADFERCGLAAAGGRGSFSEVGRAVMAQGWRVIMQRPFNRAEAIHVKESRAAEWCV